ncbi:polysaccharide pyruvyl transferase family protein [Priestia flexa]|uniref:polysaccharide pyruvyl transferase family protein n=1 Tax=Priestia flexa TaxID=86664 RepID=UPI002E24BBE7|nr:polysaccharide pyruvyl transferase family protein [Priestia flexa]
MLIGNNFSKYIRSRDEITIVGYYGMDNFGDDLMLKTLLDEFKKNNIKVNILAYQKISWLSVSEYPNTKIWIWPESKIGKFKAFAQCISKSVGVFWGGGTCFTDEDGDGYFKYMVYTKLLMKKVGYIGVGIGNLNKFSRRVKTKILINISDVISFRDEKSLSKALNWKSHMSRCDIELVDDLANNTLESIVSEVSTSSHNEGNMVVAWRDLSNYSETTIGNNFNELANAIIDLAKTFSIKKIILIDTDSELDKKINLVLKGVLETKQESISVVYNDSRSYKEKLNILNQGNLILTSRLHIAVAAKYLNKECFVYDYSPKIKYFTEEENNRKIYLLNKDLSRL